MAILNVNYSDLNLEDMAGAIGLKVKHMPMLIGSFLDESKTIMDNLENAIQTLSFSDIKSNAHSIKGSSGNLKFQAIYEMAREVELSAQDEDENFEYMAHFQAIKEAIATIPN